MSLQVGAERRAHGGAKTGSKKKKKEIDEEKNLLEIEMFEILRPPVIYFKIVREGTSFFLGPAAAT